MQVLYLLKSEDWTLSKLRTLGTDGFCNAAFSPDSRFLLLGMFDFDLEIYDSRGQMLCVLKDQGGDLPSHAFLGNNRLALTFGYSFKVYDTWSGQLQVTRAPHMLDPEKLDLEANYEPLIALNCSGSMLAFCTARGSILHIFDARTLQELSSIYSAGGRPVLRDVNHTEMMWEPYGWILFQRPSVSNNVLASEHVRVLRPLLGTDMHTEALRCENQPQQIPACSPDGSMVCSLSSACDSIEVHDIRSGQLKMRQAVHMPVYGPGESSREVALNWSACGRWLLVKVFVNCARLKVIQLVTLYT